MPDIAVKYFSVILTCSECKIPKYRPTESAIKRDPQIKALFLKVDLKFS
jgi:hypothetical protein